MSNWYDRPEPSQELKSLEPFCGRWVSVDQHESMPWMADGGTGLTRNHFRKALDDFCYLTDIEADTPFGNIKGHGMIFYDREAGKFRIAWYDNFGNLMTGEGDYDPSDRSLILVEKYRMNGVDVKERHIDRIVDENHYTHIVETMLDGEYKLTSILNYRRVE